MISLATAAPADRIDRQQGAANNPELTAMASDTILAVIEGGLALDIVFCTYSRRSLDMIPQLPKQSDQFEQG